MNRTILIFSNLSNWVWNLARRVGETGVAQTPLAPHGKVFIHGELWDAVASTALPVGELVVVRRIDGLILEVDPLRATPPPANAVAAVSS